MRIRYSIWEYPYRKKSRHTKFFIFANHALGPSKIQQHASDEPIHLWRNGLIYQEQEGFHTWEATSPEAELWLMLNLPDDAEVLDP